MNPRQAIKEAIVGFWDYDTPKYVTIRSKWIGILCRSIQLVVLGYVIGYNIIYEHGYQDTDTGVSSITAKVKGVQYSDYSGVAPGQRVRIWDPADYVIPPQMTGAFFVMTNVLETGNQSQSRCSEDPALKSAACTADADCFPNRMLSEGNGAFTGKCLKSSPPSGSGTCEITSWCPLENAASLKRNAAFGNSQNLTVLIKNFVYFPGYDVHRSNILEGGTREYLQHCTYNSLTDPQCPIFRIGDIIDNIRGENFHSLAELGGVVSIRIDWDCDLDYNVKYCIPEYHFSRLDSGAANSLVAQGYNFRFAYNYVEAGSMRRTLVKAYGILFLVSCTARARAFDIVPLMFSIGSGIGLLSIASVVCDFAIAYIYRERERINQKKFDEVQGSVMARLNSRSNQEEPGSAVESRAESNGI